MKRYNVLAATEQFKLPLMLLNLLCRVATWSENQEKSGKTKKNEKSQVKVGVFEKSHKNSGKKLKNIRFCQVKFTKFLIFKSLRMIKN